MIKYWKELNFFEKVLAIIFRKYTYKIYKVGVNDGFQWHNCPITVQHIPNVSKKA